MLWYNEVTGELQSNKPMPTIVDDEYWKMVCKNWVMVKDDFIPPVKPVVETNETILIKITAIESKQARAVREFIIGDVTAKDRLLKMDTEISDLRKKLK